MSKTTQVRSVPVSTNRVNRTGNPVIKRNRDSITVTHREYLFDLKGNANTFIGVPDQDVFLQGAITPSNAFLFPWLSKLSRLYEEYRFDSLKFEYQPYTSTSNNGVVLMAVDYDATDDPPYTKSDLMAYDGAVRSSVWAPVDLKCPLHCLRTYPKYFTGFRNLTTSTSANAEIRQSVVGNLFVTSVSAVAQGMGEIYVSYTITFMIPQLTSFFYDFFSSLNTSNAGFAVNSFFGTSGVPSTNSLFVDASLPYNVVSSNTLSINQAYDSLIVIAVKLGVGVTNAPSLTFGTDIVSLGTLVDWHDSAANDQGVLVQEITVRNPGANLTFNINAFASLTSTSVSLIPKSKFPINFGSTLT